MLTVPLKIKELFNKRISFGLNTSISLKQNEIKACSIFARLGKLPLLQHKWGYKNTGHLVARLVSAGAEIHMQASDSRTHL